MSLPEKLLDAVDEQTVRWDEKESILYSLATGFGRDELERQELPFVFGGRGLLVSPGFATVIPAADFPQLQELEPEQVDLLHMELEIFSPLLPADEVVVQSSVIAAGRAESVDSLVYTVRSEARRVADNRALFAYTRTHVARAVSLRDEAVSVDFAIPTNTPQQPADFVELTELREDQAALYRLCGDWRARSVDTDSARRAGYPKPVLPSLCLLGCVIRSVLATVCDYDPTLVRTVTANFSDHATGGEPVLTHMWQDGPVIRFAAFGHRDKRALCDGKIVLAG